MRRQHDRAAAFVARLDVPAGREKGLQEACLHLPRAAEYGLGHMKPFLAQTVLGGEFQEPSGRNPRFIPVYLDDAYGIRRAPKHVCPYVVACAPHEPYKLALLFARRRDDCPVRLCGTVADEPSEDPAEFQGALDTETAA